MTRLSLVNRADQMFNRLSVPSVELVFLSLWQTVTTEASVGLRAVMKLRQ